MNVTRVKRAKEAIHHSRPARVQRAPMVIPVNITVGARERDRKRGCGTRGVSYLPSLVTSFNSLLGR